MDLQHDTTRPLERSDVDALLNQLNAARAPAPQEIRSLAEYAFVHQPNGSADFARASICEFFQENLAHFEPRQRYNVMKMVMDRLQQDLARAGHDYDLRPPASIGEAVGLVFRSGDEDALERLYPWVTGMIRVPRPFYNSLAHELSLVPTWVEKIPKVNEFTDMLRTAGRDAWRVVHVDLNYCDSPGDENDTEITWGKGASIGSIFSPYGRTPDRSLEEKWNAECKYSNFSKKTACQKILDICAACGVTIEPPERQRGSLGDYLFPRLPSFK